MNQNLFEFRYLQDKDEIISYLTELPLKTTNLPCLVGVDNVQDYLDADDTVGSILTFTHISEPFMISVHLQETENMFNLANIFSHLKYSADCIRIKK